MSSPTEISYQRLCTSLLDHNETRDGPYIRVLALRKVLAHISTHRWYARVEGLQATGNRNRGSRMSPIIGRLINNRGRPEIVLLLDSWKKWMDTVARCLNATHKIDDARRLAAIEGHAKGVRTRAANRARQQPAQCAPIYKEQRSKKGRLTVTSTEVCTVWTGVRLIEKEA
jgi:hypothetical protein